MFQTRSAPFGDRHLTAMLRREGWAVNPKRILSIVYSRWTGSADESAQEDRVTYNAYRSKVPRGPTKSGLWSSVRTTLVIVRKF